MGLGKTITTIALLATLRTSGETGHVLIVCPKTITHQWHAELTKWDNFAGGIIGRVQWLDARIKKP